MDQDIAVRLANEGVPVRAIARAVREPSVLVRERLLQARAQGYLLEIPCEDWPARTRRAIAHAVSRDWPTLETAVRRVFTLRPTQVAMLMLLLMHDEVSLNQLAACGRNATFATIRVALYRLRQALASLKLEIVTLHAYGYYMPQRRHAQDLILAKAAQQAYGAMPRPFYLNLSLSRTRPWESEGISRRTWYRRRAVAQIAIQPVPHAMEIAHA